MKALPEPSALRNSSERFRQALSAAVERVAQRLASAIVTFTLALVAGPREVGWYSLAALLLTLWQCAWDLAVRQAGVIAWRAPQAEDFLKRTSLVTAIGGSAFMLAVVAGIGTAASSPRLCLQLLPLVIVPLATASYLSRVTLAQHLKDWNRITRFQAIAAAASLVVALPTIALTGVFAASLQSAVSEVVFAALILRLRHTRPVAIETDRVGLTRRYLVPSSVSNVMVWGQSQTERLELAVLSGPSSLGIYSLASNLTRSLADAAASGLANHLRAELASGTGDRDHRGEFLRTTRTAVILAFAVQICTILFVKLVGPHILSGTWSVALKLIPLMSGGILPAMITVCTAVLLIDLGRTGRLIALQGTGIVFGAAVGLALSVDLRTGVFFALGREWMLLAMALVALRGAISNGTLALAIFATGASAVIGTITYIL